MITKDQLAAAMTKECDIGLHLFSKLRPDAFAYRPSPEQRSTLELLRYLAVCGSAGIRCLSGKDWKLYAAHAAHVKEMPPQGFPEAMARQRADIESFFASVTEAQLENEIAPMPAGGTLPLGFAILQAPLKWLVAYKLQLFLYAKATGSAEIGTANAWAGMDWKG